MFYGSVKTETGTPDPGVRLWGGDQPLSIFESEGLSDANGNYSIGALAGTNKWQCGVAVSGGLPQSYVFTQGTNNTTLTNNQAIRVDFVAKAATGRISGWVRNQSGSPVGGVGVYSYARIGGSDFSTWTETDAGGNYLVNVANGSWHVSLDCYSDQGLEGLGYECLPPQIVSVPPTLGYAVGWIIGKLVGDVMITREEIAGLMANLLYVVAPPAGHTKLTDWAKERANTLGMHYTSELARRRDRQTGYQSAREVDVVPLDPYVPRQ